MLYCTVSRLAVTLLFYYTYYSNHKEFFVSKKAWIIFAAVCVAVIAGLIIVSNGNKIDVSSVDTGVTLNASAQSGNIADHVYGKADSRVVFIEYGDFECPGCKAAYQPVKDIVEAYKDKIAFVFRNFPLSSIHPNARAAASAAESAGLRGKYWEMHDLLYENQSSWKTLSANERTDYFASLAKQLGINEETLKTDVTATNVSQKLNFDLALGKQVGVNSTPSFFIGSKKLDDIYTDSSLDTDKLKKAVEEAIKNNS
jgi:protein-disulfide isomerase